ncbi:MAG: hypothetical protein PSX71_09940 [bacterium]|nr:hypothetical protein [bacterium]
MIDPAALIMARARDGLYESFYFRGTSLDGQKAFWLKHNFLRRHGERGVLLEVTLVLFDRKSGEVVTAHDCEDLGPQAFSALTRSRQWEALSANLASGSFFEIYREKIRGKLHTPQGPAAWDVTLTRSDEALYHFPHSRLYQLPFPKKKILTRDVYMQFSGRFSVGTRVVEGEFVGANGHNWGTEHAHEYAYASCNMFSEDATACFDGFTAKLALAAGLVRTPYLSLAALKVNGGWHYFNALSRAYQQNVHALHDYQWGITLKNATHRLELLVDGGNPRVVPWVALHYEHPGGARSVVKNTKFATGHLQIFEHGQPRPLAVLSSDCFELETLLPGNTPVDRFYLGVP